jgi:LPS-assembly protein
MLQDYQTVDEDIPPTSRPYSRLPQLSLTIDPYRPGSGIELGLDAEYDYFDHNAKVHGHRTAVQPYASWPFRKPFGHLTPSLNFFGAAYSLEGEANGDDANPSYAIPSFNLDGTLIFERSTDWFGHAAVQTLEPRLFYLYTAYQDQEDIPVFDTSELSFSFASLFRQNRFTGRDRIGDANQLTLGLTSKTLDTNSGRELFRASVGQIVYFQDRKVQIRGPEEDQGSSAIAGEISARLMDDLSGRLSLQWDPNKDVDRSEKRVLELHYETSDDRLLNLAYRFDLGKSEATRYEDVDLSLSWPVNRQVDLVGRWYYSLLNSQTTEAFAGIEYGRCCWRLRLLGRHLKNKPNTDGDTSVMVQLVLAGLGNFGHKIDKLLERGIYGYHAD